ncbi:Collagen alpha-1(XXVIII) chain [Varanus komodoensis]|nr:Collagen alpha-1(XXVIII) chain [Varanus komodoensis]
MPIERTAPHFNQGGSVTTRQPAIPPLHGKQDYLEPSTHHPKIAPSSTISRHMQTTVPTTQPPRVISATKDARCLQPLTPGDCQDYQVKWYYASDANSCARFWYGGCKGNENRFETEEECQATCVAG